MADTDEGSQHRERIKSVLERLAQPSEVFYKHRHPNSSQVYRGTGADVLAVLLPLQYHYVRQNYGGERVEHSIYYGLNVLRPHWTLALSLWPNSTWRSDCSYNHGLLHKPDFLADEDQLKIMEGFSLTIEREWQEFTASAQTTQQAEV